MLEIKGVQGTQISIPEVEVNVDTVYKRTNIERKSQLDEHTQQQMEYWQYDEIQYTFREWLQVLSDENKQIQESQRLQDVDINATQEMVDFLLMQSAEMPMTLSLKQNKSKGVDSMAMYIVIRVEKKAKISVEEGQKAYKMFLSNPNFTHLKNDVDTMLLADGKDNLIVDLI
ncbi:hypothetical protein [Fusobacterium sp.]|uniref:hypothetical protein n=1 Tax=Fusobacterium sp. TaxID=68766 RepID=UPI0026392E1E|nr:hypothetical protein [Fusobacterium sp.]